ncbi:MAG: methyltransferase domain-containing protein [Methylobacterium mesophilicum]|nr:methyltransferase domain-containing protein [Methylobacterium mesophilicum]
MAFSLRKAITGKLDEEIRFFKGWMDQPKAVGSVIPTSSVTAKRMASVIDRFSDRPVLELGAGTGVVTRAILDHGVRHDRLICVEYAPEFVEHLSKRFPKVRVVEGDAFDLDRSLPDMAGQMFDAVISALPLLHFPVPRRVAYIEALLNRLPAGRPVVQITYSPRSPVPSGLGNYQVEHLDFVLRNFPPAQLWLYRRPWGH